jgi:hypothetical protein
MSQKNQQPKLGKMPRIKTATKQGEKEINKNGHFTKRRKNPFCMKITVNSNCYFHEWMGSKLCWIAGGRVIEFKINGLRFRDETFHNRTTAAKANFHFNSAQLACF